jgi:hypothetical protein
LSRQWEGIEQDLASDSASGMTDNSAPRATLRAQRETNGLLRAQMLLGMMKDGRCVLPKSPPSYITYLPSALTCETDKLKSTTLPESCKRDNWKRFGN